MRDGDRYAIRSSADARWLVVLAVALLGGAACERAPSSPSQAESPGDAASKAHPASHAAIPEQRPARLFQTDIEGEGSNILFVSVDTTRADHLGCYGHPVVKTPNVDRFAREGVRFAMCISSAPLTFPSHSTMMTGSFPFVHGARDNGIYMLSDANKTLAEIFKDQGYVTHAEVAAAVLDPKYNLTQGFDTYGAPDLQRPDSPPGYHDADSPEPQNSPSDLLASSVELERKADEITRYGIDLIQKSVAANERFFIWLHYFDPHWPHEPPKRFATKYPREPYYAEIAFFDEQFGKLMNFVRESGITDRTFVVLISDHGEGRGQHSEYTHSAFLYDSVLHVPLIMWAPGRIPEGTVIESQVRSVDVAPTILDFVGLEPTPQMQGLSLLPLIADPQHPLSRPAYADTFVPRDMHDYSQLRTLRTDEWKYILAPKPELYHVSEDPLELFNMSISDPDRAAEMREDLRDLIANSPPAPGGRANRQSIDQDVVNQLAALGYVTDVSRPEEDELTIGTELDHFEPVGPNPRDHIEEVDCLATGLGSFRQGRYETAELMFQRLVELDPKDVLGWSMLGTLRLVREQPDEALEMYRKALAIDPADATTLRQVAIIYFLRGDLDEAEKYVRRSMTHKGNEWQSCLLMGRILLARGEYTEAESILEQADKLAPKNGEIKLRQGLLAMQTGRIQLAKERLTQATQYRPDFVPAIYNLAKCQTALKEFAEAAAGFERAAELSPEQAPAYLLGAAAHHVLGDNKKMIDLLQLGYKNTPEDPNIGNDLAWWLATAPEDELRDGEQAVQIAEKAAASTGMEHFNELDTLAAAYAEAGRFEKAITVAKRALKLAESAGRDQVMQDIAMRLALYERNQPYRTK